MSDDNGKLLLGKRCVVTGGGSGIGRSIALCLAGAGARVAITGRREERLQETAALSVDVFAQTMDVTDRDAVDAGFERIREELGGIDVLVNNAGVGGPNACGLDGPDRWDEIVRTNLDGLFFCTRAALRYIADGGRIINISSVLGKFGVPGYTGYCASKHGVIGFTKALALEVAGRQITANAICPGWVETDMAREGMENMATAMGVSYEEARKQALSDVPMGRIIEPDEVGELVVYMAGRHASAMTGQAISLCGGSTMG
ncbi:MAG: SDR family NAD(P)-dependent oxidoreductase [Planctomycetota bacterium]|jgi:NAD(P)-dependent dehydrogenase (short-subunit alcohol dehydrogenase family)